MKHLFIGAAAMALLTGCGGSDGGDGLAKDLAEAGGVAAKSAEDALKDLGKITLRDGDAEDADSALQAMSLGESGAGRVTFADRSIDGAKAAFSDVEIAILGMDSEDGGKITVADMELDGLDMGETGPAFAMLKLSGIEVIPNDPEDAENGSLEIADIQILNPSPELAAWVSSLASGEAPAAFPDADALEFDRVALNGLNFKLNEDDMSVDFGLGAFELGDMSATRLGAARISEIAVSGIGEDGLPFEGSLGSFGLTGVDLGLIEAAQNSAGDEEEMAGAILSELYNNPMDPGFDRMGIDALDIDAGGVKFALPSLDSAVARNEAGQPVRYATAPYTMTLGANAEGGEPGSELAEMLGRIGYEQLELSGEALSDYDPESDVVSFEADRNYITLTDGLSLNFGGKLEGYSAYASSIGNMDMGEMMSGGQPDPDLMQEAISKLTLHNINMTVIDNSLVDRLFNLAAAQSGQEVSQVRSQAVMGINMAPMMAAQAGVDAEIVTELATAVSEFLQEPGTLSSGLAPEEPLSIATLSEMEDPSQINKSMLGFSATHKK